MMNRVIVIPAVIEESLRKYLFQSELEQGAFLFADVSQSSKELNLAVQDIYLVPPDGWQVQLEVYLEMKDSERSKIMALARKSGFAVIDCHSHPGSDDEVQFSPSDRYGITDFAAYANWKLGGKPFAAMVWGENSFDAVVWSNDFKNPHSIDELRIEGGVPDVRKPQGSWFHKQTEPWWRLQNNGK
jgi:hypothetical protein